MHETEYQESAVRRDPNTTGAFPYWAVLLSACLALGVQLSFQLRGPLPELFPPLFGDAPSSGHGIMLGLLFAAVVASASALGARLAGPIGALSSGLLLTLSWPAVIFVALSPSATLLALLLLGATLLFVRGGRCSNLGWLGLALAVAALIVPVFHDSLLGMFWKLPTEFSWERMVFWREHSLLASPVPLLGATPLLALGLSSVLVLRGRREGVVVAALLLLSILVWRFNSAGSALLLFVLALPQRQVLSCRSRAGQDRSNVVSLCGRRVLRPRTSIRTTSTGRLPRDSRSRYRIGT